MEWSAVLTVGVPALMCSRSCWGRSLLKLLTVTSWYPDECSCMHDCVRTLGQLFQEGELLLIRQGSLFQLFIFVFLAHVLCTWRDGFRVGSAEFYLPSGQAYVAVRVFAQRNGESRLSVYFYLFILEIKKQINSNTKKTLDYTTCMCHKLKQNIKQYN